MRQLFIWDLKAVVVDTERVSLIILLPERCHLAPSEPHGDQGGRNNDESIEEHDAEGAILLAGSIDALLVAADSLKQGKNSNLFAALAGTGEATRAVATERDPVAPHEAVIEALGEV